MFKVLEGNLKDGCMLLAGCAGSDPVADARMSGKLKAYSDILNIELEDLQ